MKNILAQAVIVTIHRPYSSCIQSGWNRLSRRQSSKKDNTYKIWWHFIFKKFLQDSTIYEIYNNKSRPDTNIMFLMFKCFASQVFLMLYSYRFLRVNPQLKSLLPKEKKEREKRHRLVAVSYVFFFFQLLPLKISTT